MKKIIFLMMILPLMAICDTIPNKLDVSFEATKTTLLTTKSSEPTEIVPVEPAFVNNAYQIGTAAELKWFEEKTNATTNAGLNKNAVLTADIDYGGNYWIPICAGPGSPSYTGIFDGAGHTISNLAIISDTLKTVNARYQQNLGFVGPLKGTVKNLKLVNVYVKNTATGGTVPGATGDKEAKSISVGTIAGWVDPEGKIDSVSVTGEIWGYGDGQGVGGIAGNCHGKITNSTSSVTIHVINLSFVGGITGLTKKNVTISNVHWQGNIIIDSLADSSKTYIGGIIGNVYEGTANVTNATFDSETVQNSIGRVNKGTVNADVLEYGIYTIKTKNNKKICELDGAYKYTVKDGVFTSNMTIDSLVFNRKFVPGKSSTIALPFTISTSNIVGAEFYTLQDVVKNDTGYQVNLVQVNKLTANIPYIIIASQPTITIKAGSYKLTQSNPGTSTSADNNWELQAIYKYTTGADRGERRTKTYGFVARDTILDGKEWHAGQFVKMGTKAYVYPFRVVLEYVGDVNSLPKSALDYSPINENTPDVIEVHFSDNAMAKRLPESIFNFTPTEKLPTNAYYKKWENRIIIIHDDKKFTTNGKELK